MGLVGAVCEQVCAEMTGLLERLATLGTAIRFDPFMTPNMGHKIVLRPESIRSDVHFDNT